MKNQILKWYWRGLIPVLAVASFYAAKHTAFHLKAYAQVTAVPFAAETASYSFAKNPQGEIIAGKTVARRSDGATAELYRHPVNWNASARSVTFLNGQTLRLFDLVSSKTTWTMKTQELAALKGRLTNPPADCNYWATG